MSRLTRRSDTGTPADGERIVECVAELHALTKLPRIGWVLAGVHGPERVAAHCWETAVIAYFLAVTSPSRSTSPR